MNEINKGPRPVGQQGQDVVSKTAAKVEDAVGNARESVDKAVDKVSEKVADVQSAAAPILGKASDQAQQLLQQGREAVHDTTQRVRAKLSEASDAAVAYTKDEPMKGLLAAAATGALLMAVVMLVSRSRD